MGTSAPSESLLCQAKRLLKTVDVHAKKSLGQHFLIQKNILQKIIDASELSSADTVIEVGPGLGALTTELAKQAGNVIAVELDNTLAPLLRETHSAYHNLNIIHADILKCSPKSLLPESESSRYKVVANLPYYITSAVLRHFLESDRQPELMVLMLQKEVARAICARPGEMSLLSVAVQLFGEPQLVCHVPAACFFPPPKVDSAVLKINVHAQPLIPMPDMASFFTLVRAGFSANRKQLPNSLSHRLNKAKEEILLLLAEAGVESRRRAETLSIIEWTKLWKLFRGQGKI
ncbi:MAG: 16S rRNA (adenine(1518)-N(6)/adenine(1519)-N(6))-dimethyltransferase RsmA [Dehalococcoidia bacterium]|nr:16S rRNA (adenine(1518)-N(6)/adenine(1519)-N(6))-dimethyltransferase RsmA [Dehalococcoidia bacterium]